MSRGCVGTAAASRAGMYDGQACRASGGVWIGRTGGRANRTNTGCRPKLKHPWKRF